MIDDDVIALANSLGEILASKQLKITTAESCTGGLIAAAITEIPGSSTWFEYGFVSYANRAKQALLGVSENTLKNNGAVSQETVLEMVTGATTKAGCDVGVAVSGVAGPDGGSPEKPVGTVWIAFRVPGSVASAELHHFAGDRSAVRLATLHAALRGTISRLEIA